MTVHLLDVDTFFDGEAVGVLFHDDRPAFKVKPIGFGIVALLDGGASFRGEGLGFSARLVGFRISRAGG